MIKKISILLMMITYCLLPAFQSELVTEFTTSNYYYNPFNGIIFEDTTFILGHRGIDSYDVGNDTLIKLGSVHSNGVTMSYTKDGDNIFWGSFDKIYKTNCSDPSEMEIITTLEDTPAWLMFTQNGYFYNHSSDGYSITIKKYDYDFNFIMNIEYEDNLGLIFKLSDNLFYSLYYDTIYLYNFNNDIITKIDSIYVSEGSNPFYCELISDSLLGFTSDLSGFKLFELSSYGNANLICEINMPFNTFRIFDNKLISFHQDYIYLYNISDFSNPQLLDTWQTNDFFVDVSVRGNRILTDTVNGNILLFKVENNQLFLLDSNSSPGQFINFHYYNEKLYTYSYGDGFTTWDLSNIEEPVKISTYLHELAPFINYFENEIISLRKEGVNIENWIAETLIINEYGIEIEDILPTSTIYNKHNNFYYTVFDGALHKYTYIDSIFTEIETLDLGLVGIAGYIFFHDDDLLIAIFNGTMATVKIDENNAMEHLYNVSIPNLGLVTYNSYEDYIFISEADPNTTTWIFNVSDLDNIHFIAEIEESGVIACDEENDLLFMGGWDYTVYDISNIESGVIPEIGTIPMFGSARKIEVVNAENGNYLIYLENTACSIYEYSDISNAEDNVLQISPVNLTNHPNPFKPAGAGRSPGTTISFKLADFGDMESALVEIYNIKGQRIKQLVSNSANQLSEGEHSVVWDGTDNQNKPVSSGVYLYTLKLGDKVVASKKMLLLK